MNRDEMLAQLGDSAAPWDFLIVGGGATGLGTAVEAASRGFHTLLLEQSDFAKGTSSRSTKLIHGGVRYLQQGNVGLVLEALRERGLLTQNAPHLVSHLAFIVPNYTWWEAPFYGVGLKIYDLLAGKPVRIAHDPAPVAAQSGPLPETPAVAPLETVPLDSPPSADEAFWDLSLEAQPNAKFTEIGRASCRERVYVLV